ncbi:MAG TPA: sigma-70 family RNA polymerase sigma factor [Candidatus Binataceae bacterium]|nr:sigma-70 family RNA polymerase sigma factor [Candidatus Binataceae bacterium]
MTEMLVWKGRTVNQRPTFLHSENYRQPDHDAIFRAHRQRILGLCRLMLRENEEAEDVTQEVFIRAFEHLRTGEPPAVMEAWLVRVAVNACRDRQRSGWWKYLRKHADLDEVAPPATRSSESEAITREREKRIWRQLGALKPQQRNVFVLRYIEGWSTAEVAKSLGLTEGSVKTHLFRAVRHLRKALEHSL